MQLKTLIQEAYNKEADIYDADRYGDVHPANIRLRETIRNTLVKYLVGNTIFELASGTGYWGKYLVGLGYKYSGVDLTPGMVNKALGRHLDVRLGDVEDPTVYPKDIDSILCVKAFTFFQDPKKVLQNSYYSLKTGGRFICFYNNKRNFLLWVYSWFKDPNLIAPSPPYERRYTHREFESMARGVGFKTLFIKDCVNLPYKYLPKHLRYTKWTNWLDEHLKFGWTTYTVLEKDEK